jgi:hypothetical protein
VTVLDSGNVVVSDTIVTFASDGGSLSLGSVVTDVNGEAIVTLSASTDPTNQTIIVTASSSGIADVILPVEVIGTTVTIAASRDVLITDGVNTSALTIKVADASGKGVYNAVVALSVDNGAVAALLAVTGQTNVSGEFTTTLTGLSTGTVEVTASAIGAVATYSFTVDTTADSLLISAPASGTTVAVNVSQPITVDIPAAMQTVSLVSTVGTWDSNGSSVLTVTNTNFPGLPLTVIENITSTEVGTATIRATNVANTLMNDDIQLVFVVTTVDADSTIAIQASPTTVAPSVGGTQNSSLLEVVVRNLGGSGIADAMVTFSMSNTTGSGEYIDPPVAYTDSSGTAHATFYSGSVSSGGGGVTVSAALDETLTGGSVNDSVAIIVNGTAGSITIGASTGVSSVYSDTMYSLPMTLLVTDSGGNPVADTAVSLSLWPERYALGYYVCTPDPGLVQEFVISNEDVDRNLLLGAVEDVSGDGTLTPPNAAGGEIPSSVTTDESGVATFSLLYPKDSAGYIYDAISATTLVQGTQTSATKRFWLAASKTDITACVVGPSPFYSHWPTLETTSADSIVAIGVPTTITAYLTDQSGGAISGATLTATVISEGSFVALHPTALGVVSGTADEVTGVSGQAVFDYSPGDQAGVDVILITYVVPGGLSLYSYVYITVQ